MLGYQPDINHKTKSPRINRGLFIRSWVHFILIVCLIAFLLRRQEQIH